MRGALLVFLLATACQERGGPQAPAPDVELDPIARDYVELVLAAGRHNASYVDAYFGPPELARAARQGAPRAPREIAARARALAERARRAPPSPRRAFLISQIESVEAFARRLGGERMSLAEEARRLFGVEAPRTSRAALEAAVEAADRALPGEGSLAARAAAFRERHRVPPERIEEVAELCIAETRARTRRLFDLPEGEGVELVLVDGAPWEAYLWYLGGYRSRIELDTSRSIGLGDVCWLMSHEGYPGHHTYSVILDHLLVRERGRIELSVYPLYSPLSVLMEGTAENAAPIIFPGDEWRAFLEERVAPAAGLGDVDAGRYIEGRRALLGLRPALAEAAHRYFDGGASRSEVASFLERYAAMPPGAARHLFRKVDRRLPISYLFTYPVGRELVDAWLGEGPERAGRFFELLTAPRPPRALASR